VETSIIIIAEWIYERVSEFKVGYYGSSRYRARIWLYL